jgi:Mlc titration factor MtfA (ptsG expression regulator)
VSWFLSRKKTELREALPPAEWLPILQERFPTVFHLTEGQRVQLFGYMRTFLKRIDFEGCGGQEITDEIRVTIAAQACLLLIGREHEVYPRLKTVLVYPHAYVSGKPGLFGGDTGKGYASANRGMAVLWCWRGTAWSAGLEMWKTGIM